ncbi:hypothetical protein [Candidatus Synechococcus spongiarum]|nr:hypothetical protein [Candidatus Synechococcus spongiarum]
MPASFGDIFGNPSATLNIFSTPVTVATSVPVSINRGLSNGMYERVGGVVREVAGGDSTGAGKMVMWLQDSKALENMVKSIPFPVNITQALQLVSPYLVAVNAGLTVCGFAQVLGKLDVLDEQIRSVRERIDDQAVARLNAGKNALQDAMEIDDSNKIRRSRAYKAVDLLHESRQYFNQRVARVAAKGEVANTQDISMAFTALMIESQAYVQLDEEGRAATALREGLKTLRPALTRLLETILAQQAVYLRSDFLGQINLEFITWLQNALHRVKSSPGGRVWRVTSSDVFEEMRRSVQFLEAMFKDWYKKIPPVVIPADPGSENWLGFLPFAPGGDSRPSKATVKENLAPGLTRIAGLVEAHDRIYGQVLQLETLVREKVDPSKFTKSLTLSDGKTAEAILFVNRS